MNFVGELNGRGLNVQALSELGSIGRYPPELQEFLLSALV
jgi:hypothetical protein